MRVRMLANVGLWESGHEVDLPDAQATAYVRQKLAEEVTPARPAPAGAAEQKPATPAGKPGGRRRTKAVQPTTNKTTAGAKPDPDAATGGTSPAPAAHPSSSTSSKD